MASPLLSIIVPVYNAENYLSIFLDSILSSMPLSLEVLLIDDGSDDKSPQIAAEYAEKWPFIHLERQTNQGPSSARNKGLEKASGSLIAFMDSDDCINAAAFRKTVALAGQSDAELWISDFCRINADGELLSSSAQIEKDTGPIAALSYMDRFLSGPDGVWNVWRCIFRRDFLEKNSLRFIEDARIAEDMEFMVRALTRVKTPVFFHNPYYHYRANYGRTLTNTYTADRVRQFCAMCTQARKTLGESDVPYAGRLKSKLEREFVLNLAVCRQVPPEQRKEVLTAVRAAWNVLDKAESTIARLARLIRRIAGLPLLVEILYLLKMLKKGIRSFRERRR